jgi:tRNA wybutosine-synthesizing protein 2
MAQSTIDFIVASKNVKRFRTDLESGKKLNKSRAITPASASPGGSREIRYAIPTLYTTDIAESDLQSILQELGLDDVLDGVNCASSSSIAIGKDKKVLLAGIVHAWLQSLPAELVGTLMESLIQSLPTSWSIYEPMLLLPQHAFSTPEWKLVFAATTPAEQHALFFCIADAFSVTHIASNAPIPLKAETPTSTASENILRAPLNLTPLFGDFGTGENFNAALWVATKQYGILQTWAPVHTMFSRGNVKEKARILDLASVHAAVEEGKTDGRGCAAVDLYAGIGYFAFSYVKAGVNKVYCWELNPWSVEGLRRAAEGNKWSVGVVKDGEADSFLNREQVKRITVFEMDNERAAETVKKSRHRIPPIRHVNCGLLPTSKGSWRTAVEVVDPGLGGWIHVHENFRVDQITEKGQETVLEIQGIIDRGIGRNGRTAVLEHIEKIKTYAPGVMHCVLDIYITPMQS